MAKISFTFSKYQLYKINHHKINRTVIGHVQTQKRGGVNRPIIIDAEGNLLAGDLPLNPIFPALAIQIWRKNKINFQLNHCVIIHQLMNEGIKFKPQEINNDLLKKCKCKTLKKFTAK